MEHKRPVNLNLFTIRFPIMAIASILHRISGVILFLAMPLFLWMLNQTLASEDHFVTLQQCLSKPFMKLILWIILGSLIYHILAGIRHMIMDMGFAESLSAGRITAQILIAIAAVAWLLIGVWLW